METTLITLLIIMFIAFPNFRANWLKTFNWFVQEGKLNDDLFGHILIVFIASIVASIVAPVITLYGSIKNQLVGGGVQQVTPQERWNGYATRFCGVFNADWHSDEELKELVFGFGWIAPDFFGISFNKMPSEKELAALKRRCEYYGESNAFRFSGFGKLQLFDFGTSSRWVVPILVTDLLQENEHARLAELARVEREKELDSQPISLMSIDKEKFRERLEKRSGEFPLWLDRQGKMILAQLAGHVLLVGATGAGKTGTLTYWVWLIDTLKKPEDELYILDYKRGKDWVPFHGDTSGFYSSAEDTKQAWDKLYKHFKDYQSGADDIGDRIIHVIVDELSSLVESFETKKERDEFLRQFKDMLRLSRSLGTGQGGYRIIVGLQQADSTYFGGTEGRGNLGIRVALGGITTDGARMLFEITDESEKPVSSSVGKGYAQIYGEPVRKIMIPYIKDREQVLQDLAERYTH